MNDFDGKEAYSNLYDVPGPEDGEEIDRADGRRQEARDGLDVVEQLGTLACLHIVETMF